MLRSDAACRLPISIIIPEGRLTSFDIFLICRNPVASDHCSRLVEAQRAFTDQLVQPILEPVFGTSIPGVRIEAFGPQVGNVVRSAETEADQMIDLVSPGPVMLDAIFAVDQRLRLPIDVTH